jgi:integrase/recombinase XerD
MAKGGRDRDVPLGDKLLETLREYWRWMKPQTRLFPGTINGTGAAVPITENVMGCLPASPSTGGDQKTRLAAHSAPLVRDSHAEAGADLRTIQIPLGHARLEHTIVYLHLSHRHLTAVANPLDAMPVSAPDEVRRSPRLVKK